MPGKSRDPRHRPQRKAPYETTHDVLALQRRYHEARTNYWYAIRDLPRDFWPRYHEEPNRVWAASLQGEMLPPWPNTEELVAQGRREEEAAVLARDHDAAHRDGSSEVTFVKTTTRNDENDVTFLKATGTSLATILQDHRARVHYNRVFKIAA